MATYQGHIAKTRSSYTKRESISDLVLSPTKKKGGIVLIWTKAREILQRFASIANLLILLIKNVHEGKNTENSTHYIFAVGLVFCACWDDHISIKLQKCGILPVCMALCLIASLILPYISMVARKILPAFLPLVSDTGGTPPSSGVFAICLILGSVFGFITFPILYFNIKHRNINDSKYIRLANKLTMLFSAISCLGLVITGAFPVGYTDIPNMFEWFTAVLWEHCLGAIMIFGGCFVVQLLITVMWWYLPGTSRKAAYIRIPFICIYILFFFIGILLH
ncbi:UNVERIFIED_CONTAM: Dram2 [Trichonephila clavipes]